MGTEENYLDNLLHRSKEGKQDEVQHNLETDGELLESQVAQESEDMPEINWENLEIPQESGYKA